MGKCGWVFKFNYRVELSKIKLFLDYLWNLMEDKFKVNYDILNLELLGLEDCCIKIVLFLFFILLCFVFVFLLKM